MKNHLTSPKLRVAALGIAALAGCLLAPVVSGKAKPKARSKVVMVGLNQAKQSVVSVVPYREYRGILATALQSVNDSVTPVLEKNAATEKTDAPGWHMNSIGVGLGLSAQVGIGPLLNLTITPQLRLIFSDSTTPIYPN